MTKTAITNDTDVLSDALAAMEPAGALFFRGSLAAPWGVSIPQSNEVLRLVGCPDGVDSVIMFHAVLRGAPKMQIDGTMMDLSAGDLVLLKLGRDHWLGEGDGTGGLTMEGIVGGQDLRKPLVFDAGPQGGSVKLICGGFFLRNSKLQPLLSALPDMVRVPSGEGFDNLSVLLRILAQESDNPRMGSRSVIDGLANLLFIELLRSVVAGHDAGGWLAALQDPVLSRALSAIHAQPGANWSVPTLAQASGVSASGLTQKFRNVLGQSPSRYLRMWRMNVAGRLLKDTDLGIAEVAEQVGYESVEAFSRKFKADIGVAPGHWRRS
jgi:AraC-like DNA-binding protein